MADTQIETNETADLIASNKVEGTAVYNRNEERLGSIHNLMIDKRSGQVEYAVLSFGGFLGVGSDFYPLPWDLLTYEEQAGGYVVDLTREQIERAPRYAEGAEPTYDRTYGEQVYGAYGQEYPFD
jgi:sporulation protein YlmC with PRC-barrel domain